MVILKSCVDLVDGIENLEVGMFGSNFKLKGSFDSNFLNILFYLVKV